MAAAPENVALARRRSLECDGLFEGLYRGYRADVYEFSLRLVGKREDAEDVTQVAFLNAYRALARGNAPRKPRAWLLAIAHNVCMRHFRLQQRRPREVQLDPEIFESRGRGSGPTAADVRSALQTLGSRERSALVLREFQGLSCAEIAARLGLTVSAVESLLFRARRSLREELEKAEITPSVPARRRRTLGGLLPWPPSLEKLFSWLASLGRGGLGAKAAGVAAATVIGAGAVVGTGVVPTGKSPASEPPSEPTSHTLLPSLELAMTRDSSGRASTRAWRAVADSQAPLVVSGTETAEASSAGVTAPAETGASPGSTAGLHTASQDAPRSFATPSPSLEFALPELEPPSLPPAPSLPEPPPLEPPDLPPPPELPLPPVPEPPTLEPPSLPAPPPEPPELPPPPELPLPPPPEPPELPPPPPLPLP